MKSWQPIVYLLLATSVVGIISTLVTQPAGAEVKFEKITQKVPLQKGDGRERKISQLGKLETSVTSDRQLLVQLPTPINSPSVPPSQGGKQENEVVQITGVVANPTDKGVEVILQTTQGKVLQPVTLALGRSYIANIPNAVLVLPQGGEFRQDNPASGITRVAVTQATANSIRVTVTGEAALPQVQLYDAPKEGLIFSFTPGTSTAQPTDEAEEQREIVVIGEQEGYRVPDTSVGTRTDTPLRDIPQSIQVVPQQVLQDRQARSITDGLENISGITPISPGSAGSRDNFSIRGFEVYGNSLVNGIPEDVLSDSSFVNVERLEVLKGPASVLNGEGAVGGTINFVTKQPLRDPFYEIGATIGSFNDYQGTIDLTGPLNASKTALYRFIAGYRSAETFVDFNEFTKLSIAPSLSFSLGQNTDLVLEGDVNRMERNGQQPPGLPAVGTVLPNPNGRVSRSFSSKGEVTDNLTVAGRVGYRLEHRFNENLRLRNAFRYRFYDDDDRDGSPDLNPTSLADDNRTLNRAAGIGSQFYDFYYLDTNLLGKLSTGSIEHQLLFGFSLSRNTIDVSFESGIPAAPVDIFDPDYDNTVVPTGILSSDSFTTRDTLGIYLQDQITLAENLKLLLGGRVDFFEERATNRLVDEETTQSDTAFSPRVGIVYQPIPAISLYGSFTRSFTPSIGVAAGGDTLEPERGKQYEVGIKADVNDRLSATLALYDLTRSNVTSNDPDNPDFSIQTGRQNSQGIELDISGEILPGWNIIGGYAYTDARVIEDVEIPEGNRLFSAPEHAFNLWTTYRIQQGNLQGLGFGLGFYYVGERAADLANTLELPSYFRTDAAIFYEREQFRAAINFRNLFDIEYFNSRFGSGTLVAPGEPFTVQGTVSWQF